MPVAHSPQRPAARALPVWLWRAYLHGALWPLLAIELLLCTLAGAVGVSAGHALDAAWETRVRAALALQAELEAHALAQRLADIAGMATLLADRALDPGGDDPERWLGRLLLREPALAGLQVLDDGATARLLTPPAGATGEPAVPWRVLSGDGAPLAEARVALPAAGRELRLRVRLEALLAAGAWPAEVWLVAGDGQVLARLRDEARLRDALPPEVVQLASGSLRAPSDRLYAWAPVGPSGWRLVLRQPLDAVAPPSTLLLPGLWLLAGLAGCFLLLYWQLRRRARRISGQMVRPLRAIEGLVRRIGRGDYAPPAPKLALLELQDTADAVLEMGLRLGTANRLLVEQGRDLRRQAGFRQVLIDSVPVPLFYTGADGRLLGGNLAFRAFAGERCDGGEALARRLLQALPGPGTPVAAAETVLDDGEDGPRHLLVSRADFTGVGDGDGGQVGVVLDLTERRRTERELETARDRALAASRQKSDFLASVSHEIRTPMNGVIGMAELLLHTEMNAEQRDYARTILGSAQALLQLLNDILDFSKIEAGQITLAADPFDPGALVEGAAELLAARAWEKGLVLATHVDARLPLPLYGDAGRVRQVLLNLVGNAVKFTDAGEVVVSAEPLSHDGRQALVRYSVADTGIGIPEAARARMFRPFSQLEGQGERRYAGTGLGLSICKRLCELMGGDITFESTPGRGSVFRVTLPFRRVGDGAPPPAPAPAPAALPSAALLLDGLPDAAHAALAGTLRGLGLHVFDPAAATDAAGPPPPALRAVCVYAPPIALRAQAPYPSLPGVLLAARDEPGLAARAEAQGWAAVLVLPVRRAALRETLAGVLYGRRASDGTVDPAPVRAAVVARGATLLLAEDDRTNQRVASAHLRKLGFAVDVVGDGEAAVAAAAARHYPLILMDVQMPLMDGLQAAAAIRRAQAGGPGSVIVALTANAMQGDRERFLAAGMDDYLSKPFSGDALRRLLDRWLPAPGEG